MAVMIPKGDSCIRSKMVPLEKYLYFKIAQEKDHFKVLKSPPPQIRRFEVYFSKYSFTLISESLVYSWPKMQYQSTWCP